MKLSRKCSLVYVKVPIMWESRQVSKLRLILDSLTSKWIKLFLYKFVRVERRWYDDMHGKNLKVFSYQLVTNVTDSPDPQLTINEWKNYTNRRITQMEQLHKWNNYTNGVKCSRAETLYESNNETAFLVFNIHSHLHHFQLCFNSPKHMKNTYCHESDWADHNPPPKITMPALNLRFQLRILSVYFFFIYHIKMYWILLFVEILVFVFKFGTHTDTESP